MKEQLLLVVGHNSMSEAQQELVGSTLDCHKTEPQFEALSLQRHEDHIHVCTQVYKHAYTHVYTHVYTCLHTCLHTCLRTCLHICLHTCRYIFIHTCLQSGAGEVFYIQVLTSPSGPMWGIWPKPNVGRIAAIGAVEQPPNICRACLATF